MQDSIIVKKSMELMSIPSTAENKPGLGKAVDFMEDYISNVPKLKIERFESNGVPSFLAYSGERPEKFDVILNGHVDVVPAKEKNYHPYIVDNKLYGRGAYDMKVAAVILADIFKKTAGMLPLNIGLQIVADEEVGGFNGTYHQLKQGIPKTDFVIAGEMTDLEICNETRGISWVDVHFKGVGAHGGYAWEGKNAINMACQFVDKLLRALPIPKDRAWTTTANIACIETNNDTYNKVPERAMVKVDFRFTPNDQNFSSHGALTNFIKQLDSNVDKVDIKFIAPAVEIKPDHPSLKQFTESFTAATGQQAKLIKRYASGDGRHFADFGQNCCIEYGPSGAGMHADNEHVNLDSLEPYRKSIIKFLDDLSQSK